MNRYNDISTIPAGDSWLRFNKRHRYGTDNSEYNRFKQQNHSGLQYSQNRKQTNECYQPNQYEITSKRDFYGKTSKRQIHSQPQQTNQSSPYSHKSTKPLSPTSSSLSAAKQNILNLSPTQPKSAQITPGTVVTQNQQDQPLATHILQTPNYYGFNYTRFSTYNADLIATAASATYRLADGIDPFMWQTITSTPPPKLPQQKQLLLSQQQQTLMQPPLPSSDNLTNLHSPPPIKTLSSSDNLNHLSPTPRIPAAITDSPLERPTSTNSNQRSPYNAPQLGAETIVKKKAKRKNMSMRKLNKTWCEKDVRMVLKAEESNALKLQKDVILIIRFPDPEISREIVKCYSPDIESVHFQLNFAPRYCLAHLKPGVNVEKTMDDLSKIQFGTGFLSVEMKEIPHKAHSTNLNDIDPFTLYVGNLPTTIACKTIKEHFPGATRIDIGFAQRMKYTRYAFIRYQNVPQAIEAYKRMSNAEIGGRTLAIRFRRLVAAYESNKDCEAESNNEILHEDLLIQTTVSSEDNLTTTTVSQTSTRNSQPINSSQDENDADIAGHHSNGLVNATENDATETERNIGNNSISTEDNRAETSVNSSKNIKIVKEKCAALKNVKAEPYIDPDDVVIRDNTIPTRFASADNNFKQEEENLALYEEFFGKPRIKNYICDKSRRSEIDATSQRRSSSNSLGEFLQMCQRSQIENNNNNENLGQLRTKRNKVIRNILHSGIKREPLENNDITEGNLSLLSKHPPVAVERLKQNLDVDNENVHDIRIKNSYAQNICTHTNKKVITQREKITAANNSEDSYSGDNVPPTALFFRSDYQNMLPTNTNSDSDYDEFYETRASSCLLNVKTESSQRRSIVENTNVEQNMKLNGNNTINNTMVSKEKHNTNTATTSTTYEDDNDLVPPQNLLGSYHCSQNVLKREMEHDDIFSEPFHKRDRLIENINSKDNDSITNNNNNSESIKSFTSQSNNTFEVSNTNINADDDDEDVTIIYDNLKNRYSKSTTSSNLDETNFFFPKQTDLVSLIDKPIFVTNTNREISKLIYRDHLDRLYDQLDTDSDSEL